VDQSGYDVVSEALRHHLRRRGAFVGRAKSLHKEAEGEVDELDADATHDLDIARGVPVHQIGKSHGLEEVVGLGASGIVRGGSGWLWTGREKEVSGCHGDLYLCTHISGSIFCKE